MKSSTGATISKWTLSRTDWVSVIAIVVTSFLYNRWLLDSRTFFYADDWAWLYNAEFLPWHEYLGLVPFAVYNDRPVGAAFIKVLYQLVGLNHFAFQFVLLLLHAINCILLYSIAVRYTRRGGALIAALLAATWFSTLGAVGWPAAIFDLLGATLCLSTVLFRQLSIWSGNSIRYDLAGAACYLLAIRTKEFALGAVVLVFLMTFGVERQSFRATLKQLLPYLVVFGIYAIRYGQLLATAPLAVDNPYHLDLAVTHIAASLGFYVLTTFYAESAVDSVIVAGVMVAFGIGMTAADEKAQRTALFGIAAYVIMLGPTLLLPAHRYGFYLYAPHFFLALAIGALVGRRIIPTVLAGAIAVAVLVPPIWIHSRQHTMNWYVAKGEASRAEFNSAVNLLTPLAQGATVFISGVEPFVNPFSHGPGKSLNTAFKDSTINVVVERPEAELISQFCELSGPKRFLRFTGTQGSEITAEMERGCHQ